MAFSAVSMVAYVIMKVTYDYGGWLLIMLRVFSLSLAATKSGDVSDAGDNPDYKPESAVHGIWLRDGLQFHNLDI